MPKVSHGATRSAGKKKAKKRAESPATTQVSPAAGARESAQRVGSASSKANSTVIQFRPRSRDAAATRTAPRAAAVPKQFTQTVDYSYVFTDLKIIGLLITALLGGLIVLSFLLR